MDERKIDPGHGEAFKLMHEALEAALEGIAYTTPSGHENCRFCDEHVDNEGTHADKHEKDCWIHEARAALSTARAAPSPARVIEATKKLAGCFRFRNQTGDLGLDPRMDTRFISKKVMAAVFAIEEYEFEAAKRERKAE